MDWVQQEHKFAFEAHMLLDWVHASTGGRCVLLPAVNQTGELHVASTRTRLEATLHVHMNLNAKFACGHDNSFTWMVGVWL